MRHRARIAATIGTAATAADTLAAALLHDTTLMLAALPVLALWVGVLAWHTRGEHDHGP